MKLDYDTLATEYAHHRTCHPGVLASLAETLAPGRRVLEVGCGTGNYAAAMAVLGCEVWGWEPSEGMRATAVPRLAPGRVLAGRAERLDFADGSFDLVFSVDVIHHVEDRAAFHREAFRVLKPGGRFCTATDSEEVLRARVPLTSHFPETLAAELARYPKAAELRAMMEAAGFQGLQEARVEFPHRLTDIGKYRDKAYSSLHLIPEEAFARGMARLGRELQEHGFVEANALYSLFWGTKPGMDTEGLGSTVK